MRKRDHCHRRKAQISPPIHLRGKLGVCTKIKVFDVKHQQQVPSQAENASNGAAVLKLEIVRVFSRFR